MESTDAQYFEDLYHDDVGKALKAFREAKTRKENHFGMSNLQAWLFWQRYKFNDGKRYRYGLGQVGKSYIIKVGPKKRGLLSRFRDRYVRVVCTHSRGWTVHQWFGTVKLNAEQAASLIQAKDIIFVP